MEAGDHEDKAHPWRRCPKGKHFVKEHSVHVPLNKKNPNGSIIIRHAHCATNRSRKQEYNNENKNPAPHLVLEPL